MVEKYQELVENISLKKKLYNPGVTIDGLVDVYARQVFAGDMIEWYQNKEDSIPISGVVLFGKVTMQEAGSYGRVQFEYFGFYVEPTDDDEVDKELRIEFTNALIRGECEVIGNIFVDY